SGTKLARGGEDEELDHVCELFEGEPSPALAVLDAAAELGHSNARVYLIAFAEDVPMDDVWRFDESGVLRHFVREGDDGILAGVATPEEERFVDIAIDARPGATEDEQQRALDSAIKPHRGTTFLSAELGGPALSALLGALFAADERIDVRLID